MLNGVFMVLGIGTDTDHRTGRAETLSFVFDGHTYEGTHYRLVLVAIWRPVW